MQMLVVKRERQDRTDLYCSNFILNKLKFRTQLFSCISHISNAHYSFHAVSGYRISQRVCRTFPSPQKVLLETVDGKMSGGQGR